MTWAQAMEYALDLAWAHGRRFRVVGVCKNGAWVYYPRCIR